MEFIIFEYTINVIKRGEQSGKLGEPERKKKGVRKK